ncbi:MAG: hypothetical protein K0S70_3666, partial [Microbacterium sp.]|nr:hypothetical protein [Microbacterium sp.]
MVHTMPQDVATDRIHGSNAR